MPSLPKALLIGVPDSRGPREVASLAGASPDQSTSLSSVRSSAPWERGPGLPDPHVSPAGCQACSMNSFTSSLIHSFIHLFAHALVHSADRGCIAAAVHRRVDPCRGGGWGRGGAEARRYKLPVFSDVGPGDVTCSAGTMASDTVLRI